MVRLLTQRFISSFQLLMIIKFRDKLKKIQKDNLQSFVRKMEEASEVTRQELKECFLRMMSDIKVELDKVELIKSTELVIIIFSNINLAILNLLYCIVYRTRT